MGDLVVGQLRALPLGPRRSPANRARMTGFAQWVLREIEKVYLAVYADDCITAEPEETCAPAFDMIVTVVKNSGWNYHRGNAPPRDRGFHFRGENFVGTGPYRGDDPGT